MKYPAPALAQGLEILETIIQRKRAAFSEIEKNTGINANTLNRCLVTLCELGYVEKRADGKYAPGLRLCMWEGAVSVYQQLKSRARPTMERIVAQYGVTAILHGVQGERMYVLDKAMSIHNIAMKDIGWELNLQGEHVLTPWGMVRMMAAGTSPEDARPLAEAFMRQWNEKINIEDWLELYRVTCRQGHCVDECQIVSEMERMAVPVYGPDQTLIGVAGIGSFRGFLEAEARRAVLEELLAWGEALSVW